MSYKKGDRVAVLVKDTSVWHDDPDFDPDYGVLYAEAGNVAYCVALPSVEPAAGDLVILEVIDATEVPYESNELWRIVDGEK